MVRNNIDEPNSACTGQVGFVASFRHLSGFEFFLLPKLVHARPPASNANRYPEIKEFNF